MLKRLRSRQDDEAGFTLIELLVVILVIGILAAIAIPVFLNQQKASLAASVRSDVRNTVSNVQLYIAENPNDLTEFYVMSGAGTGDNRFKSVNSNSNTTVIARGTAKNYFVLGRNTSVGPIVSIGSDATTGGYKYTTNGFGVLFSSGTGKTLIQNN